jgi:hypothetical protein
MVPSGIVSATVEAYDAVNAKLELNDCDAHDALAWKAWLNGAYDALIATLENDDERVCSDRDDERANDDERVCSDRDDDNEYDAEMDAEANDAETATTELIELDAHDADNTEPLTRNQLLSVVMSTR